MIPLWHQLYFKQFVLIKRSVSLGTNPNALILENMEEKIRNCAH